jgi:hypothetical protein
VITVVVPVSPIPSHPDTDILDETLASVRHHLPDVEIILTFDGVRLEQTGRRSDYNEFTRRALINARKDRHTCPLIFTDHQHQSGMIRAALPEVRTPLLMYIEQDTPLVTDEPINWDAITRFITDGHSNSVRLHHEAHIPEVHDYLMHGSQTPDFMRTSQWSQRPHIASVAYYRRIINDHFTPKANCFLEDRMYGVVVNTYLADGMPGWQQHRLHIYTPNEGRDIKRSYHTDGRAGEAKFDDRQVW